MTYRFKSFEIRKPTFIGEPPTPDYYKYNFDVVRWADDNTHCFTIGSLHWDKKNAGFEFKSCGLRYLQYAEPGLNEWLLLVCKVKEFELLEGE